MQVSRSLRRLNPLVTPSPSKLFMDVTQGIADGDNDNTEIKSRQEELDRTRRETAMITAQDHHLHTHAVLLGLLQGDWIARAIQMAAILDLAGLLKDGPKHVEDLAHA